MWRVDGPGNTLVLVGTIEAVSKSTKWDPKALTDALRAADRVMFPALTIYTASPFSAIGWYAKWDRMSSLPKGTTIRSFVNEADMQRLARLQQQKVLKANYPRRHPLHLSNDLRSAAEGKLGTNAKDYVRKAVRKHKLKLVPLNEAKARPLVKDLFASAPSDHVPCLRDSISMAEAGRAASVARSEAWARRDVISVLASPAQKVWRSCWPAGEGAVSINDMHSTLRRVLSEPQATVAVIDLEALGSKGGLLDRLQADGFEISGPAWR